MARRVLTPEEERQIAILLSKGQNSSQIAKALNLAYQTVHRRVLKSENVKDYPGISRQQQIAEEERLSRELYLQKNKPVSLDNKNTSLMTRKRRNNATTIYSMPDINMPMPEGLVHKSTRHVFDGQIVTFVHDTSGCTISLEIGNREPLCLEIDAFMLFADDIDKMERLLFGAPVNTSPS